MVSQSDDQSIERRLEDVEKEHAELKREVRTRTVADPAQARDIDWLKRIAGSFVDDTDYLEAVRLGRAWRRRQPKC